jgi:alkanesulfonate monooxygenase SsuD/methylene tetrahydromethanopterin reductase-like flavin-dependent oxidoreductase (luciferase family)
MQFGLFNLCTHADQAISPAEVLAQMKIMVEMSDQGGFDVAWFAEHHLSTYSISPSPLVTAAHMAGFTKNVRLGTAVVVLPFYEPLRLVEDIFYVDQLTEGRLILGLGTGYQPREFDKFGFAIESRLQRGMEIWDVIHQAQQTNCIDYQGEHINIRDAALSISPLQQPIPVFAVGNAPEVRQRIIERNATALCTPGGQSPEFIGTLRSLLDETCIEMGGDPSKLDFGVQRYVFITEDAAEARLAAEEVLRHARLATNMRQLQPQISGAILDAPAFENEPTVENLLEYSMIGSAEHVAETIIHEARQYGMTHLSAFMQFAAMPYAQSLKSLDRFCDKVIPMVRKELS